MAFCWFQVICGCGWTCTALCIYLSSLQQPPIITQTWLLAVCVSLEVDDKLWIRTRPWALCGAGHVNWDCIFALSNSLPSIFCFFIVCFSRQQYLLCKISGNFTENLTSFYLEIPFILILTINIDCMAQFNISQSKSHFNSSLNDVIRPGFLPYLSCLN